MKVRGSGPSKPGSLDAKADFMSSALIQHKVSFTYNRMKG